MTLKQLNNHYAGFLKGVWHKINKERPGPELLTRIFQTYAASIYKMPFGAWKVVASANGVDFADNKAFSDADVISGKVFKQLLIEAKLIRM